jgi:hypothetical protein
VLFLRLVSLSAWNKFLTQQALCSRI